MDTQRVHSSHHFLLSMTTGPISHPWPTCHSLPPSLPISLPKPLELAPAFPLPNTTELASHGVVARWVVVPLPPRACSLLGRSPGPTRQQPSSSSPSLPPPARARASRAEPWLPLDAPRRAAVRARLELHQTPKPTHHLPWHLPELPDRRPGHLHRRNRARRRRPSLST